MSPANHPYPSHIVDVTSTTSVDAEFHHSTPADTAQRKRLNCRRFCRKYTGYDLLVVYPTVVRAAMNEGMPPALRMDPRQQSNYR